MILSGIQLQLTTAPQWRQVLAWFKPLVYLVDAQRALFDDPLADPAVWQGGIAAVVLVVIGLSIGFGLCAAAPK